MYSYVAGARIDVNEGAPTPDEYTLTAARYTNFQNLGEIFLPTKHFFETKTLNFEKISI